MNGTPTEVNYYPGQYLTANLFRAEQAYHVTMRERHNLAGHDWGIALGLRLSAGYVDAGYAIDGYGRELVLSARTSFPLGTAFDELGTDSVDVSLVYGRSTDATGNYTVEKPVIKVDRALGTGADRRHPNVAAGSAGFDATGTAPHDTLHPWPVYLGTITRDATAPTKAPVISGDPVYVGVRAAQVFTPAGDAHLDLGQDVAVYAANPNSPALQWQHASAANAGQAQLTVGGALTVDGDLSINGGRVALPKPGANSNPGWQLDHTTTNTTPPVEQLRLVLGDPTAAGTATEFVVGCFSNGQFTPCLTVAGDGTVTVHGNLVVEGTASLNGTVLA